MAGEAEVKGTRHALLSVYDKEGIVEFGRELVRAGWTLWASGGTRRAFNGTGVPCNDVAALVGEASLDHRVAAGLTRQVNEGLLSRYGKAEDDEYLQRMGVPRFDLFCGDLYPLEKAIAAGKTYEQVTDMTDVGGPTMLRAAAKGGRIIIADVADRATVLDWLKAGCPNREEVVRQMGAKAERIAGHYAIVSARYKSMGAINGMIGTKALDLKYGENPSQSPAALFSRVGSDDPLALSKFEIVEGTAPSFNNLCDLDRVLQTATHLAAGLEKNGCHQTNIAVAAKHGNPCGASYGPHAVAEALAGDPRAIFGGVVLTTKMVDEKIAMTMATGKDCKRLLLDMVVAPSFTDEAKEILARKHGKCRLLANPALSSLGLSSLDTDDRFRYVRGGWLEQPNYTHVLEITDSRLSPISADLIIAWAVGATSNSNTITLVNRGKVIGNGVGQQDRVSCCELAVKRARDAEHDTQGAVAYSDGMFPFKDGPEVLVNAGVKAILAPLGSVRDNEIIEYCASKGVELIVCPERGFYAH